MGFDWNRLEREDHSTIDRAGLIMGITYLCLALLSIVVTLLTGREMITTIVINLVFGVGFLLTYLLVRRHRNRRENRGDQSSL